MKYECKECGDELNDDNWHPSLQKKNRHVCKRCEMGRQSRWRKANPEKVSANVTRASRKRGYQPFNDNKDCALFFGVHVAERVLSHVFKDVEKLPMHNPGYDFICNRGKKIDVKSACLRKNDKGWVFGIRHNTKADYFLCLAFDNREDLTPLHAWLIPGGVLNSISVTGIHPNTVSRWSEYELDISKVSECCNIIRGN